MRVQIIATLGLLVVLVLSCQPSDRCGGEHYFDPEILGCRACPSNATFKDDTCVCPDGMRFDGRQCQKLDGSPSKEPDAGRAHNDPDAGSNASSARCDDYCAFTKGCWADNPLAAAAIADVVSALHGDDPAACLDTCETASSGDAESTAVVACIAEGTGPSACLGDETADGLMSAGALLAECCGSQSATAMCKEICAALRVNPLAAGMTDFCD